MAKKEDKEKIVEGEVVTEKSPNPSNSRKVSDGRFFLGAILIMLGALIFLENFFPGIDISKYFWPSLLILFGFSMVFKSL